MSAQPEPLPDYVPARMLNEFVYCPRLFFYEWVEGVFAHSADTVSPVDYKRGAPRDQDGVLEAWPADRVQVCVQALVLRDNGYRCDEAVLKPVMAPFQPTHWQHAAGGP